MNVSEAYEFTLSKLEELEKLGATIVSIPSKSRNIDSIIKKYENMPGRLDSSRWIHVTIVCKNQAQINKMWESRRELSNLGIRFDTGAGCYGDGCESNLGYNWELDWSFNLTNN